MTDIALPPIDVPALPTATSLELVEAEVWKSVYNLTRPGDPGRLRVVELPSGTAFLAPEVDVLFFNRVIGLGCLVPPSPDDLAHLVTLFGEAGCKRFFIQLAPPGDRPEIRERLLADEFVLHNRWAKLVRSTAGIPDADSDLRIEEVGDRHAPMLAELASVAFDWPRSLSPLLERMGRHSDWRFYAASEGAKPVAISAMRVLGQIAYFGPSITVPAHRGRGAQAAFIVRRLRDARAMGCRWAVAETAEDRADAPSVSFRNLRKAGFNLAYLRPNYLRKFDPPVTSDQIG